MGIHVHACYTFQSGIFHGICNLLGVVARQSDTWWGCVGGALTRLRRGRVGGWGNSSGVWVWVQPPGRDPAVVHPSPTWWRKAYKLRKLLMLCIIYICMYMYMQWGCGVYFPKQLRCEFSVFWVIRAVVSYSFFGLNLLFFFPYLFPVVLYAHDCSCNNMPYSVLNIHVYMNMYMCTVFLTGCVSFGLHDASQGLQSVHERKCLLARIWHLPFLQKRVHLSRCQVAIISTYDS